MGALDFAFVSSSTIIGFVVCCTGGKPAPSHLPLEKTDNGFSTAEAAPVPRAPAEEIPDATVDQDAGRPSCSYEEAIRGAFPEDMTFSALLDGLRREPRDAGWARRAEPYLEKARHGSGSEAWRLLECRQSACVVGLISNKELHQRLADLPWSGASGSRVHLRRDGCHEVLYTFWRHPRDYAGAPGGRVLSTQPFVCASGRRPKADAVDGGLPCAHFYRGMCFANQEELCACVCSVFPRAKPRCIAATGGGGGGSMGCVDAKLEFGQKWPP